MLLDAVIKHFPPESRMNKYCTCDGQKRSFIRSVCLTEPSYVLLWTVYLITLARPWARGAGVHHDKELSASDPPDGDVLSGRGPLGGTFTTICRNCLLVSVYNEKCSSEPFFSGCFS